MYKAGLLRHRVTIQNFTSTQDPVTGEVLPSAWTDWATAVAAAIEPLSGREFIAAQQVSSELTTRITIRARAGVVPVMRIVHGTTVYDIKGILPDKDSGLEYLTLMCSSGINAG